MESAINVARYICEKYRDMSGETIDEMKLHKLLYFSQRECFAITGQPLFNDSFEGWKYGPVCVSVRNGFFNGEIVIKSDEEINPVSAYIVNNVLIQYGPIASWKLSQLSHEETSWINSRKGISPEENGSKELLLSDIEKDSEKVRPYDPVWDMYIDEFEDFEERV